MKKKQSFLYQDIEKNRQIFPNEILLNELISLEFFLIHHDEKC